MNSPRALTVILTSLALWTNAAPAETTVEQAAAAIKQGEFTRAEDLLTPLIASGRADAAAWYNFSIVRLVQRQNAEAIKCAERAVKADPTKLEYLLQLGAACKVRASEADPMEGSQIAIKMRKTYEKALALDPKCLPALFGLVFFYEKSPEVVGGDLKKAREFAERVRQLDPYRGELELGRIEAGRKNLAEALIHYDAASKLKPDDLATATACGWTLFQLGRKDEARARFEAVLKINPDFGPAKMGLTETAPPAH